MNASDSVIFLKGLLSCLKLLLDKKRMASVKKQLVALGIVLSVPPSPAEYSSALKMLWVKENSMVT